MRLSFYTWFSRRRQTALRWFFGRLIWRNAILNFIVLVSVFYILVLLPTPLQTKLAVRLTFWRLWRTLMPTIERLVVYVPAVNYTCIQAVREILRWAVTGNIALMWTSQYAWCSTLLLVSQWSNVKPNILCSGLRTLSRESLSFNLFKITIATESRIMRQGECGLDQDTDSRIRRIRTLDPDYFQILPGTAEFLV